MSGSIFLGSLFCSKTSSIAGAIASGHERRQSKKTVEKESTSVNFSIKSAYNISAGLNVPKGTGFYSLRRTAATIAARSCDPFAVQRLLGHANLMMATRYVQDFSAQTDRVIENSRMYICASNA